MEQTKKPRYSTRQNLGFMLGLAWQEAKSIPFYCIGISAATAGGTIAQLKPIMPRWCCRRWRTAPP